ncbi:MAG: WD40 repeat domain-containing protein [Cyanobacteria bacterium]|nr:WD40 repeat domain-containing protein [Cyanobacteriota bacterium]
MSVDFSPDGKFLASSSVDGDVKLWDIGNQDFTVDLDALLYKGCSWIGSYLTTNQSLSEDERNLCEVIEGAKK